MNDFSCPNCHNSKYETVLFKNGYEIVRCGQCGLQSIKTMPGSEAILAYYQNPDYYQGQAEGYRDYMEMGKVLLPLADRRLRRIESLLPASVEQRGLLDVGCAAGFFLERAKARGWRIAGVELAAEMAHRTQQRLSAPIYASVEDAGGESTFDAIACWEVIEHLPTPYPLLHQVWGLLKPGGILALSTPNTGHWQVAERPDQWESYRPPAHLLFFTRSSLETTLEAAGFEIISIQGSGPLPRLPGLIERLFEPVRQGLARGDAPLWNISIYVWRAVRALALMRDRLLGTKDDVMMTLEVMARKPC